MIYFIKKVFLQHYTFKKFIVRIKEEIITMHCPAINLVKETVLHISPKNASSLVSRKL